MYKSPRGKVMPGKTRILVSSSLRHIVQIKGSGDK